MTNTNQINLLALIERDTPLKRVSSTNGGEYAGPCPWCGGNDRFRVWPHRDNPGYWCRQCQRTGNAVQYIMDRDGVSAQEALSRLGIASHGQRRPSPRLSRPLPNSGLYSNDWEATRNPEWQQAAGDFVKRAIDALHAPGVGRRGLDYLSRRGLSESVATVYDLGYNPKAYEAHWGNSKVHFPAGALVIPWYESLDEGPGKLLKVKYRSVVGKQFGQATGGARGLYGWPKFHPGARVVLVESELCALSVWQVASELVVPLATGSATEGRLVLWVGRLALASQLLLAFDADDAGSEAAQWWQNSFPEAVKLVPTRHDVNDMLTAGDDIAAWLSGALSHPDIGA
jgi:DNA primase